VANQPKYQMGDIVELDGRLFWVGLKNEQAGTRTLIPMKGSGRRYVRAGEAFRAKDDDIQQKARLVKAFSI